MNGVIYARYSSDSQREESIDGQLRECEAFAKKNDIIILGTYIDRALTAKTDNRPDFQRMISDSAKGMFDVIIVWKLDRFARNRYDSAHYKRQLGRNGVKVLSATEPISNDATGILLESMLEGMAEYYSVELAEKINRGMTENVIKGKYNGGRMTFGYAVDDNRNFIIDPKTAPIVQEVFKLYADGKKMEEIRAILAERGVRTKKGEPHSLNFIENMLRNRRYVGEYRQGDIVNPDAIPPIVTLELFDSVQERLAKNAKAPAREKAKEDKYLLTTKLFCGTCGAFMVGESGTSKTKDIHRYYKCSHAKRKKGCSRKSVRKNRIEDIVVERIKRLLDDDSYIETITGALMAIQSAENVSLPMLEKQLAEADKAITNMLDAIQQGVFTPSTKQRLEELEARKSEIETDIAKERIMFAPLTKKQLVHWLHRFRELDTTVHEQRQRLIDTFLNSVYIFDDRLAVTINGKDVTETVTLAELKGSDLDCFAPPQTLKHPSKKVDGCFIFYASVVAVKRDLTRLNKNPAYCEVLA
jgi:DNA invertase Pin-like site-specific DNA recombinase